MTSLVSGNLYLTVFVVFVYILGTCSLLRSHFVPLMGLLGIIDPHEWSASAWSFPDEQHSPKTSLPGDSLHITLEPVVDRVSVCIFQHWEGLLGPGSSTPSFQSLCSPVAPDLPIRKGFL